MRNTKFKIAALAFPRISFKIPQYYIEGVECFMPRIREILKVDSEPGSVKDNGFIINAQKIFSFCNRTGSLIIHYVSVDLFNRWPIACVKIGASLISSTFNDHVTSQVRYPRTTILRTNAAKSAMVVSLQTICRTPNIY